MKRKIALLAGVLLVSVITARAEWKDITSSYFSNPGFDNNQTSGWMWNSNAQSQTANYNCFEFWNGVFDFFQGGRFSKGKYRLSMQGFYRKGDFDAIYEDFLSGNEQIPAVLYASIYNEETGQFQVKWQKPLASVFSYFFPFPVGGSWAKDGREFPNNMYSAAVAFADDAYQNVLEFELKEDAILELGVSCQEYTYSNWCIFDNFKLEYCPESFVTLSADGKTLTFSYGVRPSSSSEKTYPLNEGGNVPEWRADGAEVTKVVFDPSFANARPTTMARWFNNLSKLTDIEGLEYLNTSEVTYLSYMFLGCSSLKTVDLSSFDTSKVTLLGYMFQNCTSLESVSLGGFDTQAVTSFYQMFKNCKSLREVDLSSFTFNEGVETRYMFDGCTALRSLAIPESMGNANAAACVTVGTESEPCSITAPAGFDFGVDTSGACFQWKGGYFHYDMPATITAAAVDIAPMGKCELPVSLANSAGDYNGYQFEILLPDGVTLAREGSGYAYKLSDRYSDKNMSVSISDLGDGYFRVFCFSLSNTTITGTGGPIITLRLQAEEELGEGVMTGWIKSASVSRVDGRNVSVEDAPFTINVSDYKSGDINHDFTVNVTDVMLVVTHILGIDSEYYHGENADVNGDGTINVTDAMIIVDWILTSPHSVARRYVREAGGLLSVNDSGRGLDLMVSGAEDITACQMRVSLPGGKTLRGVTLPVNGGTHEVAFSKVGDGVYNIVVYSPSGHLLRKGAPLLRMDTGGCSDISVTDIEMTDTRMETVTFPGAEGSATGIDAITASGDDSPIYTIQGIRTDKMRRGVNIKDRKKILRVTSTTDKHRRAWQ